MTDQILILMCYDLVVVVSGAFLDQGNQINFITSYRKEYDDICIEHVSTETMNIRL